MSNHANHRRGEKYRSEHGPRYENADPGHGCNSTHVARGRRKWKTLWRRAKRRVALFLLEDDLCDCLDPWTCGRPHAGSPEGKPEPLVIDGLAPLSPKEEDAFNSCMCPRCRRPVNPIQWERQCVTMKCPWCDHLVDPD